MLGHGPLSSGPISAASSGIQVIAPSSIDSAEAFGTPFLLVDQAILAAGGIASAEAFGAAKLTLKIVPSSIASAEAFGAALVENRLSILVPSSITSAEAFSAPAVVSAVTISPEGIASAEAFGVALLQRSGVAIAPPTFVRWRPVVTLAGVDVSAQLVGEISVEAEEGAARLADLRLAVAAGTPIDLAGYSGAAVTIDFAEMATDGSAVSPQRLFTGRVDLPAYDFTSRTISLRCTDDLQGVIAALAREEVDALLGAGSRYSSAVFEETTDVWRYAQDRGSTLPASLDLSPAGVPRVTSWVAAASADLTLDEGDLLDDSVEVALANRDQVRNRIAIDFAYRFPRCKKRGITCSYTIPGGYRGAWWQFLAGGYWALTRDAVRSALSSAGWSVMGGVEAIEYTALPASGTYYTPQNEPMVWSNDPTVTAGLCVGFSAQLVKQYTQTIEERYAITVENAASVAALGALPETRQASLEAEFDADAWEEAANKQLVGASYVGVQTAPVVPALTAVSASLVAGEKRLDYAPNTACDRAAASNALETLVAEAQTRILAAHRQNAVRFACALVPGIDVDRTLALDTATIAARGKVRAVTHTMDLGSGAATSQVELAIVALAGLGFAHPADPVPPLMVRGGTVSPVTYGYLPDDDHVLTIELPAIEDASRDNAVQTVSETRAAPLVEDLFEVTA